MVEQNAPRHRPIAPYSVCRHAVMLEAFQQLKRYDRNVTQSDALLERFEDAWRNKDADDIMALLTAALADRVVGF